MPTLELRDHPGRRRNMITGDFEPQFPELRSIWLDEQLIGYCSAVPDCPICLIVYMEESERDAVLEYVAGRGLRPTRVSCPPKQPTPPRSGPSIWVPDDMETDDDE